MGNVKDITGKKFGLWTVIKLMDERSKNGHAMFLCQCECGTQRIVNGHTLRSGKSKSCGCNQEQPSGKDSAMYKHGGKKQRLYGIYRGMIDRCQNPNNKWCHRYGGRGISVCKEWRDNYPAFRQWAFANGYDPQVIKKYQSIDRIDNDGNYDPGNCKWSTSRQQNNNRSNNVVLEFNGQRHTVAQWARIVGLKKTTLLKRLNKYGYSVEEALFKPLTH